MAPHSPTPPNSTSLSSTEPNFTNCHSCNHQTNPTNPRNTLQPLDSVWRIILLCNKCLKSINSGQTCPYCLKSITNSGDSVKCSVCKNQIHMSCVRDFISCTPWCYSGIGFGEFITCCMDCWVPDFRKISVRFCEWNESEKLLDKELAVRFRRIFRNVPRFTNREFSIDPFDLRVWRILNWKGVSYKRRNCNGGKVELLMYKRDKNRKVVKIDDVSDKKFELDSGNGGASCSSDVLESLLCINVERFGENFATYKRKRNTTVHEAHFCQLNQSPWDVMTDFSPPCSPPLFPQYQVDENDTNDKMVAITKPYISRLHSNSFRLRTSHLNLL